MGMVPVMGSAPSAESPLAQSFRLASPFCLWDTPPSTSSPRPELRRDLHYLSGFCSQCLSDIYGLSARESVCSWLVDLKGLFQLEQFCDSVLGWGQAISTNNNVSEFSTRPPGTQTYNELVHIGCLLSAVNLGVWALVKAWTVIAHFSIIQMVCTPPQTLSSTQMKKWEQRAQELECFLQWVHFTKTKVWTGQGQSYHRAPSSVAPFNKHLCFVPWSCQQQLR